MEPRPAVVVRRVAGIQKKEAFGMIPAKKRESYHPALNSDGTFAGGERDSLGRLRIIESQIDFAGKRVLDLGCSGGFFSFLLANKAKSVTGIDADRHMIEKNRRIAEQMGLSNIDFRCERITPEFLGGLPKYDVVLFLSVFHHMITNSVDYDWSAAGSGNAAQSILVPLRNVADILVFEIGRPEETFAWSGALKTAIGEPRDWVKEHVFGSSYKNLEVLAGAGYQRWPFRWWPQLKTIGFKTRVGRKLIRMTGVNQSDFREIYIGWKE